ncbi:metal-dependent hydrolase [Pseudoduganella sp.]|uniref:metal-dependent hydrolase n=1 Tax=Pseudoduganella sp. TaxID=1880898 RepID=UPI0035AD925D
MPTILSHPAVPLALGLALGRGRISRRLLAVGMLASIVPDLDVVAFRLGIDYAHQFGHRGASHSLAFALALGALAALAAPWLRAKRWVAMAFVALACVSHPLLDMLTTGGLGAALWWPLSEQRLFFPLQVIRVSPLTLETFFGPRGLVVLRSELLWVWLPCLATMLAAYALRTRPPAFHATPHGVFQPIDKAREATIYGATFVLLVAWHIAGDGRLLGSIGVIAVMGMVRYFQLRRSGPDGAPIVALHAGALLFANPGFRKSVERIPLAAIEQVKIYGPHGNRYYRFLLAQREALTLALLQHRAAEDAVANFLQQALPGKVVIAPAPATFFEQVRGDA